jgi:hypothetical protein
VSSLPSGPGGIIRMDICCIGCIDDCGAGGVWANARPAPNTHTTVNTHKLASFGIAALT